MNTSMLSLPGIRRLFSFRFASAALMALVLLVGVMPATAHAQGRFIGRSFGRGLGWGLGFGIGNALVYSAFDRGYYYNPTVVYSTPAPVYYVEQPAPQTVYVNSAPAPVAAAVPVAIPTAAPVASNAGALSKIVYDANGKPMGVLLLNADGSQQFVPLAK